MKEVNACEFYHFFFLLSYLKSEALFDVLEKKLLAKEQLLLHAAALPGCVTPSLQNKIR